MISDSETPTCNRIDEQLVPHRTAFCQRCAPSTQIPLRIPESNLERSAI